ncbi:MAG: AIR synthase-related protein, partial [Patescibacteria group bacterium]
IDGSRIQKGDVVLSLASSGVHTNGFSLVRKILETAPDILKEQIDGKTFIEAVLTPHRAYYMVVKDLFLNDGLTGLAHITGGGIKENLNRILPEGLSAQIDLSKIKILPIFKTLKQFGTLEDADMLRPFNMGVGMTAVVHPSFVDEAITHLQKSGVDAYKIGEITEGDRTVDFISELRWK